MQPNEIRIFHLYFGCEVQHDNGTIMGKYVGKLIGYDYRYGYMLSTNNPVAPYKYCNPEYCQLILTDLSEITDEDAEKIAEMGGYIRATVDNGKAIINYSDNELRLDHCIEITDFLRSRFYMLPAYGIENLFEAEIAIRKTKN